MFKLQKLLSKKVKKEKGGFGVWGGPDGKCSARDVHVCERFEREFVKRG